jgi:hypothetical protein
MIPEKNSMHCITAKKPPPPGLPNPSKLAKIRNPGVQFFPPLLPLFSLRVYTQWDSANPIFFTVSRKARRLTTSSFDFNDIPPHPLHGTVPCVNHQERIGSMPIYGIVHDAWTGSWWIDSLCAGGSLGGWFLLFRPLVSSKEIITCHS